MTPERQRIAIAEACGWTYSPYAPLELKHQATACWFPPKYTGHHEQEVPDYLNDLNAMHEAEKVFRTRHTTDFIEMRNWLFEICGRNADFAWHATAAQRAEAFLRTLNLWKI
jgi:hypothetical protein